MTARTRLSWTDVRDTIRARILDRTYAPGDKLPRDEDLAVELGCARVTVHRAMQELSQDRLVERRRKGGTQVRVDPVTRATFEIPITRLEVEARGCAYGYRLISRDIAAAPSSIQTRFGLQRPDPMLHVKALHLADDKPYILEDRWVDTTSNPDVMAVDLDSHSANEWLVRNKPYSRVDVRFYAVNAVGDVARHLCARPGSALLVIERTTWNGDDPITTVQSVTAPGYQVLAQT